MGKGKLARKRGSEHWASGADRLERGSAAESEAPAVGGDADEGGLDDVPRPNAEAVAGIERLLRRVPDFPRSGVTFADLMPVFADGMTFRLVVEALASVGRDAEGRAAVDLVAGVDARGFLLASGVALDLCTGVLAVRKAGKLPPPVHTQQYLLEYGEATLEIPAAGVDLAGRRVLIVDDVLATGGTIAATAELLRRCGATVTAAAVVLEIPGLGGREALDTIPLTVLTTC
jgi:adenine phosphoribosyltransferase